MVSEIKIVKVTTGVRFVFPFQEKQCLWEVGSSLGWKRWQCKIVNGTFLGIKFESECVGQEAAFDENHMNACVGLDDLSARVIARLGIIDSKAKEDICPSINASSG